MKKIITILILFASLQTYSQSNKTVKVSGTGGGITQSQLNDTASAIRADFPTGGSGTVTDVSALTIGTTGSDLSSSVANGTTTPVITLNVPTASASNRGALSSTDWSTFNGKASTASVALKVNISDTAAMLSPYLRSAIAAATYQPIGSYQTALTFTSPLVNTAGTVTINNAAADGSTKGAASFTANDFNASSGNISLDYTNGQAATSGQNGFLASGDWTTFNGKQAALNGTGFVKATGTTISYDNSTYLTSLSGAALLATANTFTTNGALSAPSQLYNGTWITGGTATTTKPYVLFEPAGTTSTGWSTSGTGLGINAASGFTGNLLQLQRSGAARFTVDFAGNITGDANITAGGNIAIASTGFYIFSSRSKISSPSDGIILMQNGAGSDFTRLQFGGTSNLFPAWARSTTELRAVLADNSGYTAVQSLYDRFGSGSPESAVTAPVGAVYHRTDGGAGTSFYVKESGTGNTGWIAK